MIDLCDSDEDVVEVMKEEKGASRNGGGSNKENSPDDVEVIPPKEPTRADLAAAAAKRRAQYEAHIASFGGAAGGTAAPGDSGMILDAMLTRVRDLLKEVDSSHRNLHLSKTSTRVRIIDGVREKLREIADNKKNQNQGETLNHDVNVSEELAKKIRLAIKGREWRHPNVNMQHKQRQRNAGTFGSLNKPNQQAKGQHKRGLFGLRIGKEVAITSGVLLARALAPQIHKLIQNDRYGDA